MSTNAINNGTVNTNNGGEKMNQIMKTKMVVSLYSCIDANHNWKKLMDNINDNLITDEEYDKVLETINSLLSDRQRRAFMFRTWFDGEQPLTYGEIANRLGSTPLHARNTINKAFRKLSNNRYLFPPLFGVQMESSELERLNLSLATSQLLKRHKLATIQDILDRSGEDWKRTLMLTPPVIKELEDKMHELGHEDFKIPRKGPSIYRH